MFEKEAEEYANEYGQDAFTQFNMPQWIEPIRMERKLGFQKGAEFGYNKANEWHYVKDGDLPPKTTLVLIKACGCFILGWLDDNDVWHNDSDNGARIPKENIITWKEIVLPELKESE